VVRQNQVFTGSIQGQEAAAHGAPARLSGSRVDKVVTNSSRNWSRGASAGRLRIDIPIRCIVEVPLERMKTRSKLDLYQTSLAVWGGVKG
jgi:hypothetical protein